VRATQDNFAIQPLRRADRALLTAPQLTGAGAQRRGARPRGALRARQDLQLALSRGASNQNRIYSVMALSNQSGQLAERYGYTPYGKRRVVSPAGATLAASAVGNQVGFTGRYHDGETQLTYFRARYQDAELGRFVSRDPFHDVVRSPASSFGSRFPLGRMPHGTELYTYTENDPANETDPSGELPFSLCRKMCKGNMYCLAACTLLVPVPSRDTPDGYPPQCTPGERAAAFTLGPVIAEQPCGITCTEQCTGAGLTVPGTQRGPLVKECSADGKWQTFYKLGPCDAKCPPGYA